MVNSRLFAARRVPENEERFLNTPPKTQSTVCERRCGEDRRKGKPPIFSKYWLTGRRVAPRRIEDRQGPYSVDLHGRKTLFFILLIIMLSVLDAGLTLYLIAHGAAEINPVMLYFLRRGPTVFFAAKYILTSGAILLVLANKNDFLFNTRIRVKILLALFTVPFVLVVQWELYLILFVM
jgi:hypothetical protein